MKRIKWIIQIVALGFAAKTVNAVPLADLVDLSGKAAALAHTKPKELVIFWATWCPDCKKKLIDELPAKANDPDVQVITVNTEKDLNRVKKFVTEEKIAFPVFSDPQKTLRRSLEVFSVPSWAVYERAAPDAKEALKLVAKGSAFEIEKINAALGKPYLK